MKRLKPYFILFKIIFDFILLFLSFFIAKQIRLYTDLIPNIQLPTQTLYNDSLLKYALLGTFITMFLFSIHGLYKEDGNNKIKEYSKIILYNFYSFIFFSVIVYLSQGFIFDTEIPRLIIGFSFIISSIFLIINRIFINFIRTQFIKKSKLVIIVNKLSDDNYKIIDSFKKSKNYELIGVANNYKVQAVGIEELNIDKLEELIKNRSIDEILYIDSDLGKNELEKLKNLIFIFDIKYKYIPSIENSSFKTEMTLINNIPALEVKTTKLDGGNLIIKRIFDIISSIIGIIIFSPIYLLVFILIKLEDPKGPVFYKNRRVGRDGEEFDLYKFRYMKWKYCTKESYNISEKEKKEALEFEKNLIKEKSTRTGPLYKISNDPRKTKIGAFIEKYSIDELPQFFNVFLGNMSLVGPRPHQPREVEKYDIEYIRLLTIKPGITGMAQVNGREENDFDKEAELDIYYIENWSILLDLKIILKTFIHVLSRAKK